MINSNERNLTTSDYLTQQWFYSNIIRNKKIFITKYIEQHIFLKTGTNDVKEMFTGTSPIIF